MRKKLTILLSLITVLCLAAGCSSSGSKKQAEATTEDMYDMFEDMPEEPAIEKPGEYVKLGEYKGITVTRKSAEVTDEEVMNEIKANMGSELVEVTDRDTVKKGDILDVDYETTVDGEVVDEYMQEGRDYYLGENEFAFLKDDIDKELIGKKVGDQVEVNTAFVDDLAEDEIDFSEYDDDYDEYEDELSADDLDEDSALDDDGQEPFIEEGADDEEEALAGKACVVTITINAIQKEETPELNDDYVKEYTEGEYKTVDEYKAGIKAEIEEYKQQTVEEEALAELLQKIVDNSEQIKEFPDKLVEEEVEYLTEEISMDIYENMEGDEVDAFDDYFKKTYPEYKDITEYAKAAIKQNCVYDLLVEAYEIEPTDAQIKAAAETYLDWGYESVDQVMEEVPESELKLQAVQEILTEKMKADNNIVDAK